MPYLPKKNQCNNGFTILETLVAITILLMAIAGPLTIAEKGLTAAVSSQDQLTASYLAQDLMEYIKNVRDDNILLNNSGTPTSWLAINGGGDMSTTCLSGNGNACDFDTTSTAVPPSLDCNTPGMINGKNLCRLYLDTTSVNGTATAYYSPTYSGTATKFSRAFAITLPPGSTASTATSSVVTVTVGWKTGTVFNQVVIQDIIFNTSR